MRNAWRSSIVGLVSILSCVALAAGVASSADELPETRLDQTDSRATVEEVYQRARGSLAVITVAGRDGKRHRLGSGFVVTADGLVATNMHVIGEGRPIEVQMADGKRYDVTHVHAADRALDLAILRIDAQGLTPLVLGDSDALRQGQAVVALGNPQGLRHSVVSGVVSGRREIDGRSMIQLAIPLEQGNSGGPLVDLRGRVGGILTMKSAVTANLGFAAGVNDLKPLLERPNPVPIARWIKQGTLDRHAWQPLLGANWRTRGSQIIVNGEGDGFGGRALCLATLAVPELPFEIAVTVRLDDEAGAAGLVFAADGGDKHYGFYPSGGALRLTRFDGPDVSNWTILAQRSSPYYRPGEWNKLLVRVETQRITCLVNGHVAITTDVPRAPAGKVGLAKFRDTRAEFKGFEVGTKLASPGLSPDVATRLDALLGELPRDRGSSALLAGKLAAEPGLSAAALTERAEELSQQAEQLRRLGEAIRQLKVQSELVASLTRPEPAIDLLAAALWVARLDNDDIDIDAYRRQVDEMATDITSGLAEGADEPARFAALNKFFYEESGFHGSRGEYDHRANSHLNEVLDDREGLPITLSIVYMELARRLDLNVEGVGLPGHFVVRYRPAEGAARLFDVFDGGQAITLEEAQRRVLAATRSPLTDAQLQAASKRAIITRILHNLKGNAQGTGDQRAMLRYLDALLALSPEVHRDRLERAMLRWQGGEIEAATQDADWLLEHPVDDIDADGLRDFRAVLDRAAH